MFNLDFSLNPTLDVSKFNNIMQEVKRSFGKFGSSFQLIDPKTAATFGKAASEADKLGDELKDIDKQVDSINKSSSGGFFDTLKSGIGMGAGIALFNSGIQSVKTGIDSVVQSGMSYEKSLAEFSSITGVSGESLTQFGDKARELSVQFGGSAVEQIESFKGILSRFGPDLAKAPDALNEITVAVNTLSKASGLSAAESMDALTTSALQFGVDLSKPAEAAKEITKQMNVMAAGAKEGASEVNQASQAIVVAGSAAKNSNVSFEETNAMIQQLAASGKYGSEAGTALRNVLNKLGEGRFLPKDVQDELNAAGVSIDKLSDKTIPAADRLRELQKIQQDGALMTKLFGSENAAAGTALVQNADSIETLTKKITGTKVAFEQAAIMQGTFAERLNVLKASFQDIGLEIFEALAPTITSLMNDVIPVIKNVLTQLAPILNEAISGLKPIFDSIAPIISNILGSLAPIIGSIVQNVLPFIAEILASLAPIIEMIMNALASLLPPLLAILKPLQDILKPIIDLVASVLSQALGIIIDIMSALMPVVQEILKALAPLVDIVAVVLKVFLQVVELALRPFISIIQIAAPIIEALIKPITIVANVLAQLVSAVFEPLNPLIAIFSDLISQIAQLLGGVLAGIITTVVDLLMGFWKMIGDLIAQIFGFNNAGDMLKAVMNGIKWVVEAVVGVIKGFVEAIKAAVQWIKDLVNGIGAFFGLVDKIPNKKVKIKAEVDTKDAVAQNANLVKQLNDANTTIEDPLDDKKPKARKSAVDTLYQAEKKNYDEAQKAAKREREDLLSQRNLEEAKLGIIKDLNKEKLQEADVNASIAKNQFEAFKKVYEIAKSQFELEKSRGTITEQTKKDFASAQEEFSKLYQSMNKTAAEAIKITVEVNDDEAKTRKEVAKIKSDIERSRLQFNVELGILKESDLLNFDLNTLKSKLSDLEKADLNKLSIVDKEKTLQDIDNLQIEISRKTMEINDKDALERINAIADAAVRERELKLYEANKNFEEELKLSRGNYDKELDAFYKFQEEKQAIEEEFVRKSLNLNDVLYSGFLEMAGSLKTALSSTFNPVGEALSSLEEKLKSISGPKDSSAFKAEEEALNKSLANREMSSQEYFSKLSELDSKRLAMTEKNSITESEIWLKTQLGIAKGLAETSQRFNKQSQDSLKKAFANIKANVDKIEKEGQRGTASLSDIVKGSSEEFKNFALQSTGTAVTAFASMLAAGVEFGKAFREGLLGTLIQTAQDAILTYIPQIYAAFFSWLGPWGLAAATGAIALVYGSLEVAKNAIYAADGQVNIKGPGTETSDSIPAMVSKSESIMTAMATKAIGNEELFRWLNKTGRPAVEYFTTVKKDDTLKLLDDTIKTEINNKILQNELYLNLELNKRDNRIDVLSSENKRLTQQLEKVNLKLEELIEVNKRGNFSRKSKQEIDLNVVSPTKDKLFKVYQDGVKSKMKAI